LNSIPGGMACALWTRTRGDEGEGEGACPSGPWEHPVSRQPAQTHSATWTKQAQQEGSVAGVLTRAKSITIWRCWGSIYCR
jgi:hypothetical protein